MASSTRQKAIEIWNQKLPPGNPVLLGKILFACDNPPGTKIISGSQDAFGIVLPGLNKLEYAGEYLPADIESVHDEAILSWLEQRLWLCTLGPRVSSYDVLANTRITVEGARRLSEAARQCWAAIMSRNAVEFGRTFRAAFEAQVAMFPNMTDDTIRQTIDRYKDQALGWKLSGAGGGGYLILVSEKPVPDAIQVKIRRREG
ncbi:MAG: hypothetical protein D6714_07715 [Bacteroidetes bacterium]|nr:MAG: hypothetical protein D6714_07715 [Bacteroidota bacterium]